MAQWLSWLERRPVTAEVTSSSLVWVDIVSRRGPREAWDLFLEICRRGGIGRRPGLKIPWVVIPVPVRPRSPALPQCKGKAYKYRLSLLLNYWIIVCSLFADLLRMFLTSSSASSLSTTDCI